MPRGTANIDHRDRPVILIATNRGVRHLALTALKRKALNRLPFRVWTTLYEAVEGAVQADAANRLLGALDGLLDLGHPVYLYEPADAVRLFQFDMGRHPVTGRSMSNTLCFQTATSHRTSTDSDSHVRRTLRSANSHPR